MSPAGQRLAPRAVIRTEAGTTLLPHHVIIMGESNILTTWEIVLLLNIFVQCKIVQEYSTRIFTICLMLPMMKSWHCWTGCKTKPIICALIIYQK